MQRHCVRCSPACHTHRCNAGVLRGDVDQRDINASSTSGLHVSNRTSVSVEAYKQHKHELPELWCRATVGRWTSNHKSRGCDGARAWRLCSLPSAFRPPSSRCGDRRVMGFDTGTGTISL